MTDKNDLYNRVDTLLFRKRVFVARPSSTTAFTPNIAENEAVLDDDDIPVLTDVIELVETEAPAQEALPLPAPVIDTAAMDALIQNFSEQLQGRLKETLPRLIDKASAHFASELQQEVHRINEELLGEYLAGPANEKTDAQHSESSSPQAAEIEQEQTPST